MDLGGVLGAPRLVHAGEIQGAIFVPGNMSLFIWVLAFGLMALTFFVAVLRRRRRTQRLKTTRKTPSIDSKPSTAPMPLPQPSPSAAPCLRPLQAPPSRSVPLKKPSSRQLPSQQRPSRQVVLKQPSSREQLSSKPPARQPSFKQPPSRKAPSSQIFPTQTARQMTVQGHLTTDRKIRKASFRAPSSQQPFPPPPLAKVPSRQPPSRPLPSSQRRYHPPPSRPPPPPPPPPPPKVSPSRVNAVEPAPIPSSAPTKADVDRIGSHVEREVEQRCKHVRLIMAERRVIVLREIEFFGSKHVGGVDVFKEPILAEEICAEAGLVLTLLNNMLHDQHLAPLGLAIEGHTSASWHGHEESLMISTKRANQCERSVVRHIIKDAGSDHAWDAPVRPLVQSRGYGSTKPLADFDDEGNHEENRRVEMRLLEPGDDGYCAPLPIISAEGANFKQATVHHYLQETVGHKVYVNEEQKAHATVMHQAHATVLHKAHATVLHKASNPPLVPHVRHKNTTTRVQRLAPLMNEVKTTVARVAPRFDGKKVEGAANACGVLYQQLNAVVSTTSEAICSHGLKTRGQFAHPISVRHSNPKASQRAPLRHPPPVKEHARNPFDPDTLAGKGVHYTGSFAAQAQWSEKKLHQGSPTLHSSLPKRPPPGRPAPVSANAKRHHADTSVVATYERGSPTLHSSLPKRVPKRPPPGRPAHLSANAKRYHSGGSVAATYEDGPLSTLHNQDGVYRKSKEVHEVVAGQAHAPSGRPLKNIIPPNRTPKRKPSPSCQGGRVSGALKGMVPSLTATRGVSRAAAAAVSFASSVAGLAGKKTSTRVHPAHPAQIRHLHVDDKHYASHFQLISASVLSSSDILPGVHGGGGVRVHPLELEEFDHVDWRTT